MAKLITGIDEIATETHKLKGWCYFCLPELEYIKFEEEVRLILPQTGILKSFHGKKFKSSQANEYEHFLRLIRKYAENSYSSILSCTLNSKEWNEDFIEKWERITTETFIKVGVTNSDLIKICNQMTPALIKFMSFVNHFGNTDELVIQFDMDSKIKKYSKTETNIKGHKIIANSLMTKLYNGYRENTYLNSPALSKQGISVLSDTKSFAIQAADVIGNFSTSYIYYKLGTTSSKRILKGKIFEKVFGDKFDSEDFAKSVKIVGQNDLELLIKGSYTMTFSAYFE